MASSPQDQDRFEFYAADNQHPSLRHQGRTEDLDSLYQPSKLIFHFAQNVMYKIIYVMSMQIMRLRRQPNACRNRTGETGWIVAKLSAANAARRTVLQGPS